MNRKLTVNAIDFTMTPPLEARIFGRLRPLVAGHWDALDTVVVTIRQLASGTDDFLCRIEVVLKSGPRVASEIVCDNLEAAVRSTAETVRYATIDIIRDRRTAAS